MKTMTAEEVDYWRRRVKSDLDLHGHVKGDLAGELIELLEAYAQQQPKTLTDSECFAITDKDIRQFAKVFTKEYGGVGFTESNLHTGLKNWVKPNQPKQPKTLTDEEIHRKAISFIVSPNNPTGGDISHQKIQSFKAGFHEAPQPNQPIEVDLYEFIHILFQKGAIQTPMASNVAKELARTYLKTKAGLNQ